MAPENRSHRLLLPAVDEERVARKARILERELRRLTPRERELVTRYYVLGQSKERVLREMRASENQLRRLKSRLMKAVEDEDGASASPEDRSLHKAAGK